jgi:hypothetical protein
MIEQEIKAQLEAHLRRLRRRLRLVEGIDLGVWGLAVGLAAAVALFGVARLTPLAPLPSLLPIGAGLAVAGILFTQAMAWLRPRPLFTVARLADRRRELRARLATAWSIAGEGRLGPAAPLVRQAQLADALQVAAALVPRSAFPLRLPRRGVGASLVLALALAPLLLLPNRQEAELACRAAVAKAIAEQVAELELLQAELTELEELSETETGREVLAGLDAVRQSLAEGDLSQEEAVAVLSEAEAKLRRLQDQGTAARQAAMQEAGRRMGQASATDLNQALAEALAEGDAEFAASILADLAGEVGQSLTREEELALSDALEQAVEALSASDPDLARSLDEAAQAIRAGDIGAARQALSRASGAMAGAGQEIEAQQAAGRAAARLREGRQEVAQAGPQATGDQAAQAGQQGQAGQGGQEGQSGQDQQGQGGQSGQGQAGGAGQGASASSSGEAGAGSGSGDPGQPGEGGAVGGQMPTGNAPGQGLERVYEPIYVPRLLGGEGGEDVALPGTGDPDGQAQPLLGQAVEPGEVRVPYNEVYTAYRDVASEALEGGFIPQGMKEIVRRYFSSLEP